MGIKINKIEIQTIDPKFLEGKPFTESWEQKLFHNNSNQGHINPSRILLRQKKIQKEYCDEDSIIFKEIFRCGRY